jgi:hypothetical protein
MLAEGPQSSRRVNVLGCPYLTGRFSGVDDWPVLGVDRGLMEALKVLCGPEYDHDLRVRFVDGDAEKITLGRSWLSRRDNTGRKL